MLASVLTLLHTWILLQVSGLTAIAEGNRLTRSAADAMAKKQYAAAARDYTRMADVLGVKDDAVLANLGQAYMRQDDYANATRAYTRLSLSKDAGMRSLAHGQLGVIAGREKNPGEAVNQLKEALRQDPNNQLARLNLTRLLKRNPKMDPPPKPDQKKQDQQKQQEQEKQEQQKQQEQQKNQQQQGQKNQQDQQGQQNKPQDGQQNPDKQDQAKPDLGDQQGKQGQKPQGQTQQGQDENKRGAQGQGKVNDDAQGKGDEGKKPQIDANGTIASREQVKKMQMSEDRTRQLLDAMRSSEVQYLQQRRHRRNAPSAGSGKPDW